MILKLGVFREEKMKLNANKSKVIRFSKTREWEPDERWLMEYRVGISKNNKISLYFKRMVAIKNR